MKNDIERKDLQDLENYKKNINPAMDSIGERPFFSAKVMRAIYKSEEQGEQLSFRTKLLKVGLFLVLILFPVLTEAI